MSDQSIDLLAQRLEQAERRTARQADDITRLQNYTSTLQGALDQQDKANNSNLKLAGPIIGVVVALMTGFVGTFILQELKELSSLEHENEIRIERKDQRITRNDQQIETILGILEDHEHRQGHPAVVARLDVLTHRVDQVKKAPSLGPINETLVNVNTRLGAIENDLSSDEGKFASLTSDVVRLSADQKATISSTIEHEEEIDQLEDRLATVASQLGSTRASAAASFSEVETQIRAMNETTNIISSYTRQWQGQVHQEVFGKPLPENDYFPVNIPASAVTSVGRVNGE